MTYDLIIIGAGAAGLFAGASLPNKINGLILEKSASPGKKLLMSGAGQCNLTHGGSIKDFITHYGARGKKIRTVLYRFSNDSVIDFFEKNEIALFEREDGKIFPKSLRAKDILDCLTSQCQRNGMKLCFSTPVENISYREPAEGNDGLYVIQTGSFVFTAKKIIISTGGCSYPSTGSDGSLFPVLEALGIAVKPLHPALVPIHVQQYPYSDLSGISFQNAAVTLYSKEGKRVAENIGPLLFTRNHFSGPGILNLSRYVTEGMQLSLSYCTGKSDEVLIKELTTALSSSSKQLLTELYEYFNGNRNAEGRESEMPKRFLETLCRRAGTDPAVKASAVSRILLRSIVKLLLQDRFTISSTDGFSAAMVTAGGISLDEINLKTMESNQYLGMYFAGEVLDVDGDTGGYNLQFAFSSGWLAANSAV
ncbi:NAD(P)/FAD-dependent oxidoreductase [Anoxybacterium hadale]|uniref:NAD(P)/FAD-dependent oxidoreductase n=1 Tax=Anoxybacterium hadale TaxID=3408580 RepID=UPI003AFF9B94